VKTNAGVAFFATSSGSGSSGGAFACFADAGAGHCAKQVPPPPD